MKKKQGFRLRDVCGTQIIVAEGKENIDFSNIISMNESAAFLWEKLQDKEFSAGDLSELLQGEYEVDEATASKDAQIIAAQWAKAGIIEGEDIPKIDVTVAKPDVEAQINDGVQKKSKGLLGKLFGK